MFYQAVNLELVKILKPNGCKVLLYLMSKTNYDNYVGVNQETIQEELGYKQPKSVVEAIKELKQYNIIVSMPDLIDKRRNVYFINPYQSWKGKVAKRIEVVKKANNLDWMQLELPFTDKTI
jgi:DNA-binding MarR family transcriptional regulator